MYWDTTPWARGVGGVFGLIVSRGKEGRNSSFQSKERKNHGLMEAGLPSHVQDLGGK